MSVAILDEKKEKFLQALEANFGAPDLLSVTEGLEFPTRRAEKWKYTRVNAISKEAWQMGAGVLDNVESYNPFPELDAVSIYVVNGQVAYISEDLPEGLTIESEHDEEGALIRKNIFTALNYSLNPVSLKIIAAKNQIIGKPVHIIFVNSGELTTAQTRVKLVAEQSSFLHVMESFVSADSAKKWASHVNESDVQANANLTISKWQALGENGYMMTHEFSQQGADATYTSNVVTKNGTWTRNDSWSDLNGKNGECNLNGIYQPKGKEHIDNTTTVDHKVPHCESNELYKGVIYDASTGVFNGKVYVRPDAQLTNAFQQNSNIVMTENGTMNSKPELEIYADDVKCSHGSTTGQFDDIALFYLMARGISRENAKLMLVTAFFQEVLDEMKVKKYEESLIVN
ncbi:MAG: Fe-S cluster assembly protein SufD [Flavobacteriales bacterium]|jgi:Fe-S cluster assembly protein SufD